MNNLLKTTIISALAPVAALTIAATALPANADQIINLMSGNGTIGGTDSAITYLRGPANSAFLSAFTPADFTAAQNGAAANIITPHSAWQPKTLGAAQWISDRPTGASEGSSVLYAIDFTITDAFLTSASISFDFSVDNLLGGGPNPGLFINGTAVTGSPTNNGFGGISNFSNGSIASLLNAGVNTLYINTTDTGGPAGLLFAATITTEGSNTVAVPEPGLVAIFALGIIGLGFGRWVQNRRI